MTFDHAEILFDAMDHDQRLRIANDFEVIWGSTGFEEWHDAFAQAVGNECTAIEREMLLEQEMAGAA